MNSKEVERAELHKTIWRIANDLRGSVDGWDFKTYVFVRTQNVASMLLLIRQLSTLREYPSMIATR
ncbi:hypothetical protein AGMMS49960_03780 [Betaproteobacteria bacterium]|nr:hypothetical protein AGMMS49543_02580 [Betaproteobacteria bacterium]GHT99174.1 hypothetical protein AGMMS49960_03780 [Betaproteobacteria bacterium]